MKNSYEKKLILGVCIGLLIITGFLCAYFFLPKFGDPASHAAKFVESNILELGDIVEIYREGIDKQPKEFKGCKIEHIEVGDVPIIQFEMGARGIVPSSTYYGFYYSPDDRPHVYWNGDAELLSDSENKWNYELGGDNHGTTEQIMPHWYYYEVSF